MKLFNKFKQFSKDIKLVIITTLIMSCFGVYAAGTCIIAATADDVNYNNMTVGDALDELYTMTQTYCPPGYECFKPAIIKTTSETDTSAFRSPTYKQKIKTITLDDQINPPNNVIKSWDIGEHQDGDVMAYIKANPDDNTMYDLYIQGDGNLYANEDSSFLFYDLNYVDSLNGIDILNTTKVKNMSSMFDGLGQASNVFTLDLGDNFDTSNVENMQKMFFMTGYSNPGFTIDLGDNFDTNNVENMKQMFAGAGYNSTVLSLDLGDKFDTSNVTDMSLMFSNFGRSSAAFTLDLGNNFDTSNVENMQQMFYYTGYNNLNFTLDLGSNFDTSNVENMQQMFYYTGYNSTVFTLNLGNKFNTTKVTNMSSMFYSTGYKNNSLVLDLSTFDFSNVTSYSNIFRYFKTTQKIYVKDATAQNWIITNSGNSNLTTSNVLIKT